MAMVLDLGLETLSPSVGPSLEARYERRVAEVRAAADRLLSPAGQEQDPATWEAAFAGYRELLGDVRRIGGELRPVSLRERSRPLEGEELALEVMELFA